MKPSLPFSRRLSSRVFRQTQRQHLALRRSFSSARPLPDERHAHVNNNTGSVLRETVHDSSRNPPKELSSPSNNTRTTMTPSVAVAHDNNNNNNQELTSEHDSPSEIHYTGSATMPLTTVLHIVKPHEDVPRGVWPVFRLMVRLFFSFWVLCLVCLFLIRLVFFFNDTKKNRTKMEPFVIHPLTRHGGNFQFPLLRQLPQKSPPRSRTT